MILGIDPKVDYAFKHLLGRESTRPILIDLLNKVLEPSAGHGIVEVELLDPFNPKESPDDKLSILDVKARDQSGRLFNVEMQMVAPQSFPRRILYYAATLYQSQLKSGDKYDELMQTVSICFVDDIIWPRTPRHHLRFRLLETVDHFEMTDAIEFHMFELPKFTKTAEQLADGPDVWLYFLRNAAMINTDAVPGSLRQPMVLRAMEELRMIALSDEERRRYEARRKAQLDYNSAIHDARRTALAEGEAIGEAREKVRGLLRMIRIFEQALHLTSIPEGTLSAMSVDELSRLADELQGRLVSRP